VLFGVVLIVVVRFAPEGSIVGLIGPNGAGKTTLNGAISGVIAVRGGTIRFGDEAVTGLRPA